MNVLFGFLVFCLWCGGARLFKVTHWGVLVIGLVLWVVVSIILRGGIDYGFSDEGPIDKR